MEIANQAVGFNILLRLKSLLTGFRNSTNNSVGERGSGSLILGTAAKQIVLAVSCRLVALQEATPQT